MYNAECILRSDGYEVKKLLSSGNYGNCYFVRKNNRSYVVKAYLVNDRKECQHEADVYKELHGEELGQDWLFGCAAIEIDKICFLQLDTYEGDTLADYFRENAEDLLENKLEVLINACKTVLRMHERGYLHLDIKLSNFYISENEHQVKPIDMGSAVKISGEKEFETLMDEIGYMSTLGYSSQKLRKFNYMREEFKGRKESGSDDPYKQISERERENLVELAKSISIKDDIFSLICCIFKVVTGGKEFEFWYDDEKYDGMEAETAIPKVLKEKNVPAYVIPDFIELFMSLIKPNRETSDEGMPFATVEELIKKLEDIRQSLINDGITAGILFRHAIEYNEKYFSNVEIDEELLCDIEEISEGAPKG